MLLRFLRRVLRVAACLGHMIATGFLDVVAPIVMTLATLGAFFGLVSISL